MFRRSVQFLVRRLHLVTAAIWACWAIARNFAGSDFTGMPDNGDFHWVSKPLGFTADAPPDRLYFSWLVHHWNVGPVSWPDNPSTVHLLAFAARVLHGWSTPFDLAWFGAFQTVVMLGGVLFALDGLLRDEPSWLKKLFVALVVSWVSFDFVRLATMSTFYYTAASAVVAPWWIGAFAHVYRTGRVTVGQLAVIALTTSLFVVSKTQLAPCALGAAWLVWRLRALSVEVLVRRACVVVAVCIAVIGAGVYANSRRPVLDPVYRANAFHAYFAGALVVAPSPADSLAEWKLDASLERLRGMDCYAPGAPSLWGPELQTFFSRVSFPRLALHYALHPTELLELLQRAAKTPFLDGNVGIVLRASNVRVEGSWSSLRAQLASPSALGAAFALLSLVGLTLAIRGRLAPIRRGGEALVVLTSLAALQFVMVPVISGFPVIDRHYEPFAILFDWSFLVSAVVVARAVTLKRGFGIKGEPPKR